ncbi:MAG TPA: 50S ribosomal protein L21 [Oligoflexia bacterium]|nr:50S ribosomal protein L21 [Oligoflexia bacterium]HMP48062.1 50S ribosomal protein L21 [Oligoflexia bacterium]
MENSNSKTEANGICAVVRTSGRQYLVSEGTEFEVNQIDGEPGQSVDLTEVLLISDKGETKVGTPILGGAKVCASIVAHKRGPKLTIFKKIRRRGKEWKKGHRQDLTRLKVVSIHA